MAIEAGVSSYKKNRLKMFIVAALALAAWCIYDGYYNQKWIDKYTNPDGSPKTYLVFNHRAPYFLVPGAVLLGIYLASIVGKKVVADDEKLIIEGKEINYDSIVSLDKTYFESKGYFVLTYTTSQGSQAKKKVSDLKYDNLTPILEQVVSKIS